MKTLREIVREKRAAEEPSPELASVLPKEILRPIQQGRVPAGQIEPLLDSMASRITTVALKHRQVRAANAPAFKAHIHDYLTKYRGSLESEAFKNYSPLGAPETPQSAAVQAGEYVAMPYATGKVIEHAPGWWARLRGSAAPAAAAAGEGMTLGKAINWGIGPAGFVPMSVMSGLSSALTPLGDPHYRRGERGYIKSVGEGIKAESSELARKGEAARRKYGLLGVPVQLWHGVTHPIASLYFGGKSLSDYMGSRAGENTAMQAQQKVAAFIKIAKKQAEKKPLNPEERAQVKAKFGENPGRSFCRDNAGIYCYTHRARSKSYDSVAKIPQSVVDFIESTG